MTPDQESQPRGFSLVRALIGILAMVGAAVIYFSRDSYVAYQGHERHLLGGEAAEYGIIQFTYGFLLMLSAAPKLRRIAHFAMLLLGFAYVLFAAVRSRLA